MFPVLRDALGVDTPDRRKGNIFRLNWKDILKASIVRVYSGTRPDKVVKKNKKKGTGDNFNFDPTSNLC